MKLLYSRNLPSSIAQQNLQLTLNIMLKGHKAETDKFYKTLSYKEQFYMGLLYFSESLHPTTFRNKNILTLILTVRWVNRHLKSSQSSNENAIIIQRNNLCVTCIVFISIFIYSKLQIQAYSQCQSKMYKQHQSVKLYCICFCCGRIMCLIKICNRNTQWKYTTQTKIAGKIEQKMHRFIV